MFIILGSFCQSTSFDPWQDGGPVGGGPRSYPPPRCGGCGSRTVAALLGHLLHTVPEMFFGSAAPLKTLIILASFCQILLPLCGPRTSVVVHELRSAIPRRATRPACATTDLWQGLPMETFIILASFCQIYYPADRPGVMDAPRATYGKGLAIHYFGFVLPNQSVRSYPDRRRRGEIDAAVSA